jgi:hypothetical protein
MQHQVSTIPTLQQLGLAVQAHLAARNLSIRQGAKLLGITPATLHRATHGKPMSADHYIALVEKVWLGPV